MYGTHSMYYTRSTPIKRKYGKDDIKTEKNTNEMDEYDTSSVDEYNESDNENKEDDDEIDEGEEEIEDDDSIHLVRSIRESTTHTQSTSTNTKKQQNTPNNNKITTTKPLSTTKTTTSIKKPKKKDERYMQHLPDAEQIYIRQAKEYLYTRGYRFKVRAMILLAQKEKYCEKRMEQVALWSDIMKRSYIDENITQTSLNYTLSDGVIYEPI
jgi:hypothetical protein